MDILYLLIPISLVLVAAIALVFLWAVKSGQFEDMEGPAHRILMDDDLPRQAPAAEEEVNRTNLSIDMDQADK